MQKELFIITSIKDKSATLSLNRPRVYNALDVRMIRQLTDAIELLAGKKDIRVVVLRAEGEHFSSGADLDWMRRGLSQGPDQLKAESRELARLFRLIYESELLFVAATHGKVLGGANGLVAAADIVVAENTSQFAFSEVKLGLVPATIAPYVLRKAGHGRTAELMLTGRKFDAEQARSAGLVHYICEKGSLEETTSRVVSDLLSGGPEAMKGIKQLLRSLEPGRITDKIQDYTAEVIAQFRISEEGQEGINSFFEKRKPGWHENP